MDDVRFLRESHERAAMGMTPQKLSELVHAHGGEGWIDPLLDEVGPLLQQQLGDTADFLEIMWKQVKNLIVPGIFANCSQLLHLEDTSGNYVHLDLLYDLLNCRRSHILRIRHQNHLVGRRHVLLL